MEMGTTIGKNLLLYREKFGYTQAQIGEYLGVERSIISKYENNQREISVIFLNKLADLYTIELEDFLEENPLNKEVNMAFAFRNEGFDTIDLTSMASFQKVVKSYIQMKEIDDE